MELEGEGWRRSGAAPLPPVPSPFIRLPFWTYVVTFWRGLGLLLRYLPFWWARRKRPESIYIDMLRPLRPKPYYGVPCGGMGSGALGRDFRGGFCKFSLRPGLVETEVGTIGADHFLVRWRDGDAVSQEVLSVAPRPADAPATWSFGLPLDALEYRGLFPRAVSAFRLGPTLRLVQTQMSPLIPHDYEDSSLPLCVFDFRLENSGPTELDVSVALVFRNGTGDPRWAGESAQVGPLDSEAAQGFTIRQTIDGMPCTYAVAASREAAGSRQSFDPDGSGAELWEQLRNNGSLSGALTAGHKGGALSLRASVAPHSSAQLRFVLLWHMPRVHFGGGARSYRRRYARFVGQGPEAVAALAERALSRADEWHRRIEAWQRPLLERRQLNEEYRSGLLNELYFLVDGGTTWLDFDESQREAEPHLSEYTREQLGRFGRFLYLESWEYRMFNTYDVHFYASWALAELWPRLEHCVQTEVSDTLDVQSPDRFVFMYDGDEAAVKSAGAVPHDLGSPGEEPWLRLNAYRMHDTAGWRDLNLKWVLLEGRAVLGGGAEDRQRYLRLCFPRVSRVLRAALGAWDTDGDGLIENSGKCDQTFDNWHMEGASAYCGGLWLAALWTGQRLAEEAGEAGEAAFFGALRQRATAALEAKLWTGTHYAFDESARSGPAVFADQLCGPLFLRTFVRPAPDVLDRERVRTALHSVFEENVLRFGQGELGVVNGMLEGAAEGSNPQGAEVWAGVAYALAAGMAGLGMREEAGVIVHGLHRTTWHRRGLQYQTPEAIYANGSYRAIGYMRPLSIWAIHRALRDD